jgi:hypothetical protein
MNKILLLTLLMFSFVSNGNTQDIEKTFDTIQFNKQLELADWLVEYEYYTQPALDILSKDIDISTSEWFSYKTNNTWNIVGGIVAGNTFRITKHITIDSLDNIVDFVGECDSSILNSSGLALSQAESHFQIVRDTSSMYFSAFVHRNSDQTISIWFLPALQHSGQAIYGCEWEYVFDKTGLNLLMSKPFINVVTGVWIGQPRELWLNYRNTDAPTVGSLFFAQSFRDYFTRIRVDTKISTSTISKDTKGNYSWIHKLK